MNIQPQFLTSPEYRRFKKRIGAVAMEYLVTIGIRCQQVRDVKLPVDTVEDLELILNIDDGGQEVLDALIASGLIDPEGGSYRCVFFEEMNKQLLSNWRNGAMRAMQCKSNESNPTQLNSTQSNRMPKQCLSNASRPSAYIEEEPY